MRLLQRYEALGVKFDPKTVKIKKALRVNTIKISENALIRRLQKKKIKLEKIPFLQNGYYYESDFSMGATPEYLQGYYYLQEAASQLPVIVLEPKPGELVLDMTASPGGKTTQIAQLMQNKGKIIALDIEDKRLTALRNNLERLSVTNTVIYKKDARFVSDLGFMFDKILLDAPCSGNFCVEDNFFQKRTIKDFHDKARLQKELLHGAYVTLKKGGTLVYSTCSLEPEEDEVVIDWFIKKYRDVSLVTTRLEVGDSGLTEVFGKKLSSSINYTRRLWPHKTGTEGFFIAKMVKGL